jgi:hypothetical protein
MGFWEECAFCSCQRIFCRWLFSPFNLWCSLTLKFLFFFLEDLSINDSELLLYLDLYVPLYPVLFYEIGCSNVCTYIFTFTFCLSWKVLISLTILKDNFAEYSNLSWQLFTFRPWNISFHALLVFTASAERSGVVLTVCLYK